MSDKLNFDDTLSLIDDLRLLVEGLEGSRVNIETNNKEVNARKADINRTLLYSAHLADVVRVDLMSHYHRFKGESPPRLTSS